MKLRLIPIIGVPTLLKESEYYEIFEPRTTLDGKKQIFKNRDTYFETQFNSINERNEWVKLNPAAGLEYFKDQLIKRKDKKGFDLRPRSD